MRLRRVFPNVLQEQLVSYGPCQFPTLGFVVDRVRGATVFTPLQDVLYTSMYMYMLVRQ